MGGNALTYRLYYGTSEDGRGIPRKVGQTADREVAAKHLRKISKNPYSFGHVVVDEGPAETFVHWERDLP